MKTCVVLIGNSDDKLSQQEWSNFTASLYAELYSIVGDIHFRGYSSPSAQWQNACLVFEIEEENIERMRVKLSYLRDLFRQDSIAYLIGDTEFVQCGK